MYSIPILQSLPTPSSVVNPKSTCTHSFFFLSPTKLCGNSVSAVLAWMTNVKIQLQRKSANVSIFVTAFPLFSIKPVTLLPFFFFPFPPQPSEPSLPPRIQRRGGTLRRKEPLSGREAEMPRAGVPARAFANRARATRGNSGTLNNMADAKTSRRRRNSQSSRAARPGPGRSSSPGRES